LLGQHIGDLVPFGAVVDHQAIAELLGDADRSGDVVVAVAVLVPGEVAGQDGSEGLLGEVAGERFALAGGVLARLGVVFGLDEGFPQDGGHSEPGGGGLLLFAVDAFGVLPQGGFDRDGVADDLFVHGAPAPGLDRHGAPADRVAGTGFDHGGGHSPAQGVLEGDVFDVDTVDRAEPGTVGIGHLIGVVPGPAFSVLVNA